MQLHFGSYGDEDEGESESLDPTDVINKGDTQQQISDVVGEYQDTPDEASGPMSYDKDYSIARDL